MDYLVRYLGQKQEEIYSFYCVLLESITLIKYYITLLQQMRYLLMSLTHTPSKYGSVFFNGKPVMSDFCIPHNIGPFADVIWNKKTAVMTILPQSLKFSEEVLKDDFDIFQKVPVLTGKGCELCDPNFQKNSQKLALPCAVVLLRDEKTKKILATQRPLTMSFGGDWVLPGGHLEKGQGLIQGGLRQCEQEVGVQRQRIMFQEDCKPMLWQSVLEDREKMKVRRVAFVMFFSVLTKQFEVKEDKKEVMKWEWRQFESEGSPWGGGWAEGHLAYLQYLQSTKL